MRAWKRVHSDKHVAFKSKKKQQDIELNKMLQKEQDLMTSKLMDQSVQFIYNKEIENLITNSFGYRLPFVAETMYDDRFDMLTPDMEIYSEARAQLNVDLFTEYFTISDLKQKNLITYNYNEATKKLLWCIQNDTSIIEIVNLLQNIDVSPLMYGFILFNFIDNRCNPVKEYKKLFNLHPCIHGHLLITTFDIHTESDEIRNWHPLICTSPSPDLARFESILDWRSKLFAVKSIDNYKITPPEDSSTPKPAGLIPLLRRRNQRGIMTLDNLNPHCFE